MTAYLYMYIHTNCIMITLHTHRVYTYVFFLLLVRPLDFSEMMDEMRSISG